MNRLVQELVARVREQVQGSMTSAQSTTGELRAVFHGPPMDFLRPLFDAILGSGGIEVQLPGGGSAQLPVLLQVEQLPQGVLNPPIGQSGMCDESHLLTLRNSPASPRFVALVAPGRHRSLSVSSATADLGMSVDSNSGNATIEQWWRDDFIQGLVDKSLARTDWGGEAERDQARRLIEHAVKAADEGDRHAGSRNQSWAVLSRVMSISDPNFGFGTQLSCACGYPPMADGSIRAKDQIVILEELADVLVDSGFRPGIDKLKDRGDEEDVKALDSCLEHLQRTCQIPTALPRAASYFYCPERSPALRDIPGWWLRLTVERFAELLEEERQSAGALQIQCTNSLIPPTRGINALVVAGVEIEVDLPAEEHGPKDAKVTREAGGASNRHEWRVQLGPTSKISDPALPLHRSPARYSVEADGFRKATLKVVSLQTWGPGIFVFCRTAKKIMAPKKAKANRDGVTFECSLVLLGQGRHYLDLYVGPNIKVGELAIGRDSSAFQELAAQASINLVSEIAYGFEVDATAECQYDVPFSRDATEEKLRLHISCEESTAEGCASEFERLIRLNRNRDRGSGSSDVQIDRQARITDLQTWLLEADRVSRSYLPLVLAPDYAAIWRSPEWKSPEDTIFSKGRFVHDPRPTFGSVEAPEQFVQARAKIAERIRREDGSGLAESAQLGVWLGTDPTFCSLVEDYVRSYVTWLEIAPDTAAWVDLTVVCSLEKDGKTLVQDPDAVLVSPLHPLRLGWHCLAQRALYVAYQANSRCPAASILDPDCIPDTIALPLTTPTGEVRHQVFLSLESSSDYWTVLWNAARLDKLAARSGNLAPLDQEFGIRIGGVSSAFSVSQVQRALDDVSSMLSAKPVLNIAITSGAGQSNTCNEGVITWCRERLANGDDESSQAVFLGERMLQVYDDRDPDTRPQDAEISNLAEDTKNAVRWFGSVPSDVRPDLGIIAQLEITNPAVEKIDISTPVGAGALIRHRIRRQLKAGDGAFLSESRMGVSRPPTGDGLADRVMQGVVRLENLSDTRFGYTFAPSVHAVQEMLESKKADYAALSSSAVDPACFLGDWLKDTYLWDFDLPSYSQRAGDTNGYYLLSRVKELDRDTLRNVFSKIPGCESIDQDTLDETILEVARRGIPTVRGLSSGDSGASGDLGLLIASRVLQDEFRRGESTSSLLPAISKEGDVHRLALVIPVDPFHGYIDDLQNALGAASFLRPDLLVVGLSISDSTVKCRLTPIEVKLRTQELMSVASCKEALHQAQALSSLLELVKERASKGELLIWRLALQHLLLSMVGFGFRVYSQHRLAAQQPKDWSLCHQRFVESVLADEIDLQVDSIGRLIIVDRSPMSAPRDSDEDGFKETIAFSMASARDIVRTSPIDLYADIRRVIGDWGLMPGSELPGIAPSVRQAHVTATVIEPAPKPGALGQDQVLPHNVPPARDTPRSGTIHPMQETRSGEAPGVALRVGHSADGFKSDPRTLRLSDTKLNQLNIGVVGDLGTGKTQLLKSVVYQIARSAEVNQGVKPKILIFDYKKDYSSDEFVKAVGARVVKPHRLPINIFDVSSAGEALTPWLDRFKFFSDVLDKIFTGIGPVQRQQLKQAVRLAYEECGAMGRQPTIYDVHAKYRAALGTKTDSPLSIIDDLVDMEMFSREPGDSASFDRFLDGVVVIALNALGQDDRTKNMLVAMMLNMYYEHMLRIPKRPYIGTDPQLRVIDSFLLVDEADNIMRFEFDVLRKLLLQGREFGVGVILASQYLRHFKAGATDYREPLLTWFIHKVPNVTPQELSALGLTSDVAQLAERIKSLPNHHCLFKTVGIDGEIIKGLPFFELLQAR